MKKIAYILTACLACLSACSCEGKIELLWYDSKDYTKSGQPATRKPAYVYLPYGYDASQKYDVIYLLHGWTGVAQEYFLGRGGSSRTTLESLRLTWYNYIDPDKTVEIVNTLKSRTDAVAFWKAQH